MHVNEMIENNYEIIFKKNNELHLYFPIHCPGNQFPMYLYLILSSSRRIQVIGPFARNPRTVQQIMAHVIVATYLRIKIEVSLDHLLRKYVYVYVYINWCSAGSCPSTVCFDS